MKLSKGSRTLTLTAVIALAGCGATGGGNAQQIVTAAKAPLLATEHHDVRAFCEAYTPGIADQLALDRQPRISGDCEVAMRVLVTNPEFGQVEKRVAAKLRVADIVIRRNHATAQVALVSSAPGYTMAFSKAPNGRWRIASIPFFAQITRIR